MERILQVLALEPTTQVLGQEPIVPFAILLVVILVVPILFERLKLPGLVGLVLSGLVLGPSGWDLFQNKSSIINLLADIGLVYLMFVAGLEVEIAQWRRQKQRALGFACLSFGISFLLGILVGRIFHLNLQHSILLGSLFASHTLLAYPLLSRLGVVSNEAVTTTIAATAFTDIGALIVLVGCVAISQIKIFSLTTLLALLGELIIYSVVIVVGLDWLGKEFFRRSGDDEGNKFLFVVLTLFLAVMGAQLIGVEKIFGAFLAGLAVNDVVGEGPVKEKIVFIGSVLFIPIFFVNLGLLIDLPTLFNNLLIFRLTSLILISLIASKFIAAWLAKFIYRYSWQEMLTMWSLSIPQVGTTLAATFVGYRAGLLSPELLSSFIILMLVTSILGPLITSRTAVTLTPQAITTTATTDLPQQQSEAPRTQTFTIVVPIYNPHTQQHLVEMAALLARQTKGKIIPLAIAPAASQMDAPQLELSVQRSERLLTKAIYHSQAFGIEAEPLLRIDDAFASGISRAAREQKADLIVMGWGKRTGLRARLFGNVIDGVLWAAHCPVAVTRLVDSPQKIQRILVPLENLITPSLQPVQFAQMLAEANQAQVTVLNVCDRRTSSSKIAARRSHLSQLVGKLSTANPPEIQILAHENTAQAILQATRLYDLVVLPFIRNHTNPGGLAISDLTTQLARQITCSIIVFGEPQNTPPNITTQISSSQYPSLEDAGWKKGVGSRE
ncbi:cation:proton antiporter domain-containing protein [Nostoc sp. CMAA1605]|uniref:cation:proton antiporter domain-containing protein n=1 Tax=Nostoc sp. CMAA1605 TaxID=2055159 RepID=UPI001F37E1F8|nr:cation:proton antiporter [Nostoc sp. CMAA1605]MCF4966174.1 sodium:proton antiporter [Nostoc sp. CMAA1605]